ncbi:hypothetical protein MNBD_DELTA03-1392, partial [hydrothermal vent metagenome]
PETLTFQGIANRGSVVGCSLLLIVTAYSKGRSQLTIPRDWLGKEEKRRIK